MKVLNTMILCSMLIAPSAFGQAQAAARAARGAKDPGRITTPGTGSKLNQVGVGQSATSVRPNMGAKELTVDIKGKAANDANFGGSCTNDLNPAQKTIIADAVRSGVTGGGCLAKFSPPTKAIAVKIVGAMDQQARRMGIANVNVATVADRAIILDAGADVIEGEFGDNETAALDRIGKLRGNSCDVTGAAFDDAVIAAARTN